MRRLLLLAWLALFATPALADDRSTCNNTSGDEAIAACTRAITTGKFTAKDLARLHTNRGVELRRKGNFDAAIDDYDQAIRLDPNDLFAFNNRGNTRREMGDLDRALADYGEAIRIDPAYAAAYTNRGRIYEMKQDIERARADFRAAIAAPAKYSNTPWAKDFARLRLAAMAKAR